MEAQLGAARKQFRRLIYTAVTLRVDCVPSVRQDLASRRDINTIWWSRKQQVCDPRSPGDGARSDGRAASNGFEPEPEPARREPAGDATADGDRPGAAGQGRATQTRGEGRPDRDGAPLRRQDGVVNVPQEVGCSRTAT